MTLLLVLVFVVAMVYASVGHGGASGYLAVMALFAFSPTQMASSALLLNLLVAGTAWLMFWRMGHGSHSLLWPFVVGSVPAAFIGGWLPVSALTYRWLLAAVLLVAAVRLCMRVIPSPAGVLKRPSASLAALAGMGIGLISGMVGVGGGIFLSPLMILKHWADPKQTAAVSAGFIVVNSAAGLIGRLVAGRLHVGIFLPLVAAAFVGGAIGARLGAGYVSNLWLRRVLAVVLVIASGKWMVGHG